MKELLELFKKNKAWVKERLEVDKNYFKNLSKEQIPKFLWIGCSDARVPANQIVALEPGELFVHRNVANLFPNTDINSLSVLEYAVDILKIEHVIVCGHFGCSGVKAAMEDHHLGLVDNWLRNIRDIYSKNQIELDNIEDINKRYDRLVELNVFQQVMNICHTTIVQAVWQKKQKLSIHGWVYDIKSGLLKDLNCCYSNSKQIDEIYKINLKK
ncbi:MAG: Carbonic anhydrase 2 [Candidatus Anoxychlamydiales bacterium]|nr:Carbonic anhydrase 2 [Candidatus Anoxychlamydiales bacterium]